MGRTLNAQVEVLERRDCPAAITIADATVNEGTTAASIAQFTISLSEPSSAVVTVNWTTVDGTATVADNDYRGAMGTIRFLPGQTSRVISVSVIADSKLEPDETFGIELSAPVGATLARETAKGTILNDDGAVVVIPRVSVDDVRLPEGNVGRKDALLAVTLSAATTVPVTVTYSTVDGSATAADSDYVPTTARLTFAPGETRKFVSVGVLGDSRVESDETFSLVLTNPIYCTLGTATGTATILNDDVRPLPPPAVSVTGGSVIEGKSGDEAVVNFTVTLTGVASSVVTVNYETVDGTATIANNDYRKVRGTLVFQPGETTKTIPVTVVGDAIPESDESFSLVLTSAVGALIVPSASSASATIIDDDAPPAIRVSDVTVVEGNSGTQPATFLITLSHSTAAPVTVNYATRDGSATVADSDYAATSGVLTFAPRETQKTISVAVIGDTKPEPTETFTIVLSAPTNATIANGTGVGTIVNDDGQEGFQITVNYIGNVDDRVRTAVTQAVTKWQQVITGDVPSYVNPFNGQLVDDIVLDVRMGLLGTAFPTGTDGSAGSNTIANAGPFYGGAPGVNGQLAIRPSPRLPYWGTIGFDPANVATDSAESLFSTALHEIGHALGFGRPLLFEPRVGFPNGLVPLVGNPVNPVYIGTAAVQAYNAIFGRNAQNIPMESEGGGGTALVHWDNAAVPGELMNGFLTIGAPLSRITVGAMQDLGYQVNPAAADVYPRPGAITARTTPASAARTTTTNFTQSNLSLAFALYQQMTDAKPSDGNGTRGTLQRR